MDIKSFLQSLREVASSWQALIGYVIVVAAWTIRGWLVYRPQKQARYILATYENDSERSVALRSLLGTEPPKRLTGAEILVWTEVQVKSKARLFLLIAYVSTLIVALILVSLAISNNSHSDHRNPILINNTVKRP